MRRTRRLLKIPLSTSTSALNLANVAQVTPFGLSKTSLSPYCSPLHGLVHVLFAGNPGFFFHTPSIVRAFLQVFPSKSRRCPSRFSRNRWPAFSSKSCCSRSRCWSKNRPSNLMGIQWNSTWQPKMHHLSLISHEKPPFQGGTRYGSAPWPIVR